MHRHNNQFSLIFLIKFPSHANREQSRENRVLTRPNRELFDWNQGSVCGSPQVQIGDPQPTMSNDISHPLGWIREYTPSPTSGCHVRRIALIRAPVAKPCNILCSLDYSSVRWGRVSRLTATPLTTQSVLMNRLRPLTLMSASEVSPDIGVAGPDVAEVPEAAFRDDDHLKRIAARFPSH